MLPRLCKPLVEHYSLFHQKVFWSVASPFFEEISTESVQEIKYVDVLHDLVLLIIFKVTFAIKFGPRILM